MHSSRFPCRVCGRSTDGLDTYVVCDECAEEYELRSAGPVWDRPDTARVVDPPMALTGSPLSPDEMQERLRHLLNDW
jgi:hypothetical protein